MTKGNERTAPGEDQPRRRELRSAAARLLRRSQRNKSNAAGGAGQGRVRRVGSVVLTSTERMKRTADHVKRKSKSGTSTHSKRWTAKQRPESEVRLSRLPQSRADVQEDETPPQLQCSEGAITGTADVGVNRDRGGGIERDCDRGDDRPSSSRRGKAIPPSPTNSGTGRITEVPHRENIADDNEEAQLVPPPTVNVDRQTWISMKGQLGRANAEIIRLDGHVALLNRCNDRLEKECLDLRAKLTTLQTKERPDFIDSEQSLFRASRRRANAVLDVDELQQVFTREGVQLAIQPCFAEIYARMFHLCKRTTTETTWYSLFIRSVDVDTDLSEVDRTIVTDWRNFMVPTKPVRHTSTEECQVSWQCIVVAQTNHRDMRTMYIPECLYSRHMKGECFRADVEALNRALHEFAFVHMKVTTPQCTSLNIGDMEVEVRKSTEMYRRLKSASQSHMANRRMNAKDTYFNMLGYDVSTYVAHWKDLRRNSTGGRQADRGAGDVNRRQNDEDGNGQQSIDRQRPRLSQDETSTLLDMERDVERLLTVFHEPDEVAENATNRWRVRTFHAIAARSAEEWPDDDTAHTDWLFRNKPARKAFELFM